MQRKKYIDLLRQIALFYMFFQHSVLVLLKNSENKGIILFLYELVPICPALFLFVAGFSINISFKKKLNHEKNNFIIHLIKRVLILIIASSILFFIEFGIQVPDLFIASGILNTIGWMLIISAIILIFPNKKIILSLTITIFIIVTLLFEKYKIYFVPFNYGYEPMSPTIIYGFTGLLLGLFLNIIKDNIYKKKIIILTLGIIGVAIFTFYSIKHGLFNIFYSGAGRYTVERIFNNNLMPQNIFNFNTSIKSFSYESVWNYKMECFFACLGVVFILFTLMYFLENFFQKYLLKNIFLPGKFAFFNYFYHLTVIAIMVVVFGYNKFSLIQFLLFLSLLFISSYILSYVLLKRKNHNHSSGV